MGSPYRFLSTLAAAVLCGTLALSATAAPSAAEKETARGLVRDGRAKMKRGDLQEALKDFTAAHEIMGVPTTGLALGEAQAKVGMLVEALDTLLAVTRIPKSKREPKPFRKARKTAKTLAEELAARVPSVRVKLSGAAAEGATVTVDGKELAPELVGPPYKLNPGVHEVVAVSSEGIEQTAQVDLGEGDAREVALILEPAPPAAEPIAEDREIHPVVWVGIGVAAAGAVVGSITGSLALSKHADIAPQCPNQQCPPEVHDDLDTAQMLGTISTTTFIVGGVGAAAAIVGLFLPYGSSDEGQPSEAEAWLRLGPTGLIVGGTL